MGEDVPSAVKDRKELEVKLKEKGYNNEIIRPLLTYSSLS